MFSEAILWLWHLLWKRGKCVDRTLLPDGTVVVNIDGQPTDVHFEMVTGTQSNRQLKNRTRLYEHRSEFSIWIAPDDETLDRVKQQCVRIERAQFLLLGSDVMTDRDGDETTVDQLCGSSLEDVLQPPRTTDSHRTLGD